LTLAEHLAGFVRSVNLPGRVLFAKVWGSWSHNTQLPTSDLDYLAIYASPVSEVLSLSPPPETVDGKNPDYQAHEVRKFCELLLKGNPAIIEMLFTDRGCVGMEEWACLRLNRARFLTRRAVEQYLGYARGQMRRLFTGAYLHTSGGEYNEKWAYHLIRILLDARRIVQGEEPVVWKEGDERDLLMAIRNGICGREKVESLAKDVLAQVESLIEESALPDTGDQAFLDQWLIDVRKAELTR